MATMDPKKAAKALRADAIPRRALGDLLRRIGGKFSRNALGARVKDAPSQMSRLMQGHDEEFSAERYARMFFRLGYTVDVVIRKGRRRSRRARVIVRR